jgi:abortive infection bacteriophage resistance protein
MYQCFTQDLRIKISKNFDKVNEKELVQYLKVLTKFRNVCAHNDRLFSFTTKDDIPDTTLHSKLGIAKKGTQYIHGKRDLFSVVIAFRYLLQKKDFIDFKSVLGKTIDRFIAQTTHVTYNDLLLEMGFPANWKKISSYKI